jgi:hypothetical protein
MRYGYWSCKAQTKPALIAPTLSRGTIRANHAPQTAHGDATVTSQAAFCYNPVYAELDFSVSAPMASSGWVSAPRFSPGLRRRALPSPLGCFLPLVQLSLLADAVDRGRLGSIMPEDSQLFPLRSSLAAAQNGHEGASSPVS